jgi:hypothetical protein
MIGYGIRVQPLKRRTVELKERSDAFGGGAGQQFTELHP